MIGRRKPFHGILPSSIIRVARVVAMWMAFVSGRTAGLTTQAFTALLVTGTKPHGLSVRSSACIHRTNGRCLVRLYSIETKSNNKEALSVGSKTQIRKDLLRSSLLEVGLDADALYDAVEQSMVDATSGDYEGRFGLSAIRACRSFYYPKPRKNGQSAHPDDLDDLQLRALASRIARQVAHLTKRHVSHQTEWVRHHDKADTDNETATPATVFPLILILDNLRSAGNVGSIFRTADAAGCREVLTVGICPHPSGSGATKLQSAALGAESSVPSRHFATLPEAVAVLRDESPGMPVVALETCETSVVYTEYDSYDRDCGMALVLGHEVTGVDATVLPQLDGILEIPMYGRKNSLNVAACAPIVLFEIIRQWTTAESSSSSSSE